MKPTLFAIATILPLLAGVIPTAHAVECAAGVVRAGCAALNGAVVAGPRGAAVAGANGVRMRSAARDDPTSFVGDLGSRALAPMPNEDTAAARQERFRQLFRQYFDVEACARSAIGPYWLKATALQRQEFVGLYEDYVVIGYSTAMRALGGESFKVLGSQPDKGRVIVTSRIQISDAAPIRVDWQLNPTNRGYKVTDVIVNGISMASTQHSDLVSVIQRNSGHVPALLVALREKNASNGILR